MAKLRRIKTDPTLEEQGVWVTYVDDVELLIARSDCPKHREVSRRVCKPYLAKIRAKTMTNEEWTEVIAQAMSESILIGWRNIEDDDGKPIPYSSKKAYELLTDPRLHDLSKFVQEVSEDSRRFREQLVEDALGN